MRLIHAIGWYFPENLGGTEVYVAGLCRRLRAEGHEVLVAAPAVSGPDVRKYEHEGVPVFRYRIPAEPGRRECQGLDAVRGAERFHQLLHAWRPDVLHVHTFSTGLGLHEIRAARRAGAGVVATAHLPGLGFLCQRGTMLRWGEQLCDGICRPVKCAACTLQSRGVPKAAAWAVAAVGKSASGPLGRIPGRPGTLLGMSAQIRRNQAMQRELLQSVDRFVVLTEWARDALLRNGAPAAKVTLNRLGHAHASIARKPDPDVAPTRRPVRIGFVGRPDPMKGADVLARAVASLPKDVPLTVEFRGLSRSGCQVRAELDRILAGDPRASFRETVAPSEIPELMRSYDVLAVPSLCLEGGPTVAIEAHAVGTPVIGTRIGGLAELVTDGVNGRLVPPRDAAALAEVLRSLADDPGGTIDRWRRALPAARTMDAIADDYLSLYDEIAGRRFPQARDMEAVIASTGGESRP